MSSDYEHYEIRRNYALLVAEGILFTVGLVFFDPNTVVPLLMERLTGSALLIGVVGAVQPLSKGVLPILAGNWISSMPHKKRFLIAAMSVGRLPLLVLGVALLWIPAAPTWFWATLLLLVQTLFWFGDSAGDPAWMDMVGKSVGDGRRGRFFATRQVAGGLISIAAGGVVAAVLGLDGLAFPANYGMVVLIGALIYLANVGTFVGLVERPSETSPRLPLGMLVRRLPEYLRRNPTFARTMVILLLYNMARISMPFFIVFGRQRFGLPDSALGVIIPVQMAGRIAGALLWGVVGDRYGHHRAIRGVAMLSVLPALIALAAALVELPVAPVITFALVFLVLGFAIEGWPPYINYMLDIVPERERPMYAGLMGVAYVPATLAPIAGGLIVDLLNYETLFMVTVVLTGAGLIAARGLPAAARAPS
ncbi:MAG: MFS transporter [Spirochaetota bacterium]